MANLNIPVGVSDFAEIRKNGYYFIDKSELIEKLVKTKATKVTLITGWQQPSKTCWPDWQRKRWKMDILGSSWQAVRHQVP